MADLFSAVTTVVNSILTLLGTVATTLMSNALFQIMFGIIILSIVMGIVWTLVKKVKVGYNQMDNAIGNNFSKKTRRYYVTRAYVNSLFRK